MELMMVHKNIISPKSNGPVMGIVQDTLLGSQKLTQRDTFIERDMMMNMLMWVDDFDGNIPVPAVMVRRDRSIFPLWTGKQMYSFLLPVSDVQYSYHPILDTQYSYHPIFNTQYSYHPIFNTQYS